jgi:FkbM family methyltransferase
MIRLFERHGVDCVLDVGANVGEFGQQLRDHGFRGLIHSFEPLPDAYHKLATRTSSDAQWHTHDYALGSADEQATLNVAGNEAGASSSLLPMLPRHEQASPESRYIRAISIQVKRLDTIWSDLVPPTANPFIKIDAQGAEQAVLAGAPRALEQAVGLQLELSLVALYEGAPSFRSLLDLAESLGMQLVGLEPGFADPASGELLQVDGIFMRPLPAT